MGIDFRVLFLEGFINVYFYKVFLGDFDNWFSILVIEWIGWEFLR